MIKQDGLYALKTRGVFFVAWVNPGVLSLSSNAGVGDGAIGVYVLSAVAGA